MRGKLSLIALGFGIVLLTTGMSGGCGEQTFESFSYYYPNWMPNGRVICFKTESRWSEAIWGRRELGDTNYITAITINDSNEVVAEENLFETNKGYAEMVCSPTGEMIVVYTPGYSNGIWIYDYKGNKSEILNGVSVDSADWSPDGSKIAYSADRKLYVVNVDGTNNIQIETSAEVVAWRVGEKIVYEGIVDGLYFYLFSINQDGSNNNQIISGTDPQKIDNNKIVYSGTANMVKLIYLTGTGEATISDTFSKSTLKLSFDNTKIVGGDLITGGGSWIGGIWIINIDGTGEKRLR